MDFKKTALGLEFGSTRIKAVLIDEKNNPIASGSHEWENQLVNGVWTYSWDAIHAGLQACFADLKKDDSRGAASLLCRPEKGREGQVRRDADRSWSHGHFRHDARLPALR